jgi:hypothetical protein
VAGAGQLRSVRSGDQVEHATEPAIDDRPRLLVGRAPQLDGIVAAGVGDPRDVAGRRHHHGQPAAYVGARCQRPHRTVAVRQPRHRAAHLDCARPSIDGRRHGADVVTGVDRLRHRRLALAAEIDVDRRGAAAIPQQDVAAALEHDAPTVGGGVADVERRVGELAQVVETGQPVVRQRRRPQRARTLAIADEADGRSVVEP